MLAPMKTSAGGRRMIRTAEGTKLVAYLDCVGVWTIGTGHTSAAGPPKVVAGLRITEAEADAILARDLDAVERAVLKALTRQPTQNQFDAMVSLAFNIGGKAFAKSSIVSRFNRGDIEGASDAFLRWNKAGGRVVNGLTARRKVERSLFRRGEVPVAIAAMESVAVPPEEMPGELEPPAPPKTMATSKTGWASIASGAAGVTAIVTGAQSILETAQSVKDTAGQAATILGVDYRLALLAFLACLLVGCAVFIWIDRRGKLYRDLI